MKEQLFLTDLILKPTPSFDNFIVGKNTEVFEALTHLKAGLSIFLWGEAGAGKSHILKALAGEHEPFNASNFPANMHELPKFPPRTVVLIDDIHLFSPEQQAVLFNLYNDWQARKLLPNAFSIVATANASPMQLTMREDLRNRLGWGLVYEVQVLNDEDCKNALEQRAQAKGLRLSKEVLQWIFTYCPRDIRTLFALLEALDAYSLSQQRAITIPLLKQLIQSQEIFQ
ncbi:MAG: DnaA/Hda family protein [Pelistega sp.]|nr:DnaA/Hda family protein [Pelistega sp.]